jgi:peptidoglycan/LPS O-acetylase OafA/YrhL
MGTLRSLLAIAVVIYHSYTICGIRFLDGQTAVQSFYIISGFYMTLILNEKYNDYQHFIKNRLLRIYPAYWAVLALSVGISLGSYLLGGRAFYLQPYLNNPLALGTSIYLIFSQLCILGLDFSFLMSLMPNGKFYFVSYFLGIPKPLFLFSFIPPAWTLSIELYFYIVAPFLVKRNTESLIIILLCSVLVRLFCYAQFDMNRAPFDYHFFPFELAFFMIGAVLYKIYKYIENLSISPFLLKTIGLLPIFFYLISPFLSFEMSEFRWIFYAILSLTLPFLFLLTKNWKTDRLIGELSYPIYISHHLVLILLKPWIWADLSNRLAYFGIATLLITLIFAWLLWKFVMLPIEKWRT